MTSWRTAFLVSLHLGLAFAPAHAQTRAPLWYVGALASHVQPDSLRDSSNASGGTILFGKPLGSGFALEASAFGQQFHARSGEDSSTYGAGLDLSYVVPKSGRVALFAGGGAAYEMLGALKEIDDDGNPLVTEREDGVAPFVRAGIGFYLPGFRQSFNVIPAFHRNHWLLRADLTWYGVFNDRVASGERMLSDVRLSIGVVFAKEPRRPRDPAPEPPPSPEIVDPAD